MDSLRLMLHCQLTESVGELLDAIEKVDPRPRSREHGTASSITWKRER